MSKVLLINAFPRLDGMTAKITNLVKGGLIAAGAEVTEVDVTRLSFSSCVGCYSCWTVTPGECVFADAMGDILEKILDADILFCATPMYHYGVSADLLRFFERTFPLTAPGFTEIEGSEVMRNQTRYPDRWKGKRLGYLAVGALRGVENFTAIQEHFRLLSHGLDLELCAELIRPESFLLPFDFAKPMTIRAIENSFEKAGQEMIRLGKVTQETTAACARTISASSANFRQHSSIFWEYVEKGIGNKLNQDAVQDLVVRDVRVLMAEIITYLDPEASRRVRAVIQFDYTDVNRRYEIDINRGTAILREEWVTQKPDLRIITTQMSWAAMFLREISPMEALMSGRVVLEGEKSLFTRFEKLFPPPAR